MLKFNRRSSGRVNYPFQQRLCLVESPSPTETAIEFEWQLFHDVGQCGCSFWSTRPMYGKRLWIELGFDGECQTQLAEVCHVTEIQCLGRPLFLVGCQFVQPLLDGPNLAAPMMAS
jgi:hypothetical protein